MYKGLLTLWIFMSSITVVIGQEAMQNFGNLKVHENGAIGFHHDLINNGFTDDNNGLVGFFSNNNLNISGAFRPIFNDIEIMVAQNLYLEVGVGVTNNSNYILGNVITPRGTIDINFDYINSAYYNGNESLAKVDGYAAITNKSNFIFPIGDETRLRPLEIIAETIIPKAKSAYYFENPNNPTNFLTNFDTSTHTDILTMISTKEFWDVDSETNAKVRLTWNPESEVQLLADAVEDLRVVGWHTENSIWENLGSTAHNGDFNNGSISSDIFIPDDYSIITLGGSLTKNNMDLANYLISPNNDGINDVLIIKEVSLSPDNLLKIYNRWGRQVYISEDYTNDFSGIANSGIVVNKNRVLPSGLYFYIIELFDIDVIHQGYLYINE